MGVEEPVTGEQEQAAKRCRVLATQLDEQVIAMRQRGGPVTSPQDAQELLRAAAPLVQAITRYQLAMLDILTTTPLGSVS